MSTGRNQRLKKNTHNRKNRPNHDETGISQRYLRISNPAIIEHIVYIHSRLRVYREILCVSFAVLFFEVWISVRLG